MGLEFAAYASLAVSAASAYKQHESSQEAAREQKKAQKLSQKRADIKAARARYQAIREARIKRAEATVQAEAGGVMDSSGFAGGVGSARTQIAAGVGESLQLQGLAGKESAALQSAADAQSQAATWGAIGGVSGSIFDAAGGYKTIFKDLGIK